MVMTGNNECSLKNIHRNNHFDVLKPLILITLILKSLKPRYLLNLYDHDGPILSFVHKGNYI